MKKLIILAITLFLITGCVQTPQVKSNPHLPVVKKFKAYPDRNAIALVWEPILNVDGYYIQKYNSKTKKWESLITINTPFKSIYVDTNLKPNTFYKYRIATLKDKIPSLAKEVSQMTLPTIAPVIPLKAEAIAKGAVKIVFRPHMNERVKEYILERFNDENAKWEKIDILSPRLNVEYIDRNLLDGKVYKYRIIAVTFDNIKSNPSKVIKVSTFKKPPVILNIKATTNLPKEIKITWSPVKASYYKVYSSTSPNRNFKLIATTKNNFYVDKINQDGIVKYYKVTSVSHYNIESLINETPIAMGQTLPKPATPNVSTNVYLNSVEFTFSSPDNRAKKYLIIKKIKTGLLKNTQKKFIVNTNKFVDTIEPKKSYKYEIFEVDKYGLISKEPFVVSIGD